MQIFHKNNGRVLRAQNVVRSYERHTSEPVKVATSWERVRADGRDYRAVGFFYEPKPADHKVRAAKVRGSVDTAIAATREINARNIAARELVAAERRAVVNSPKTEDPAFLDEVMLEVKVSEIQDKFAAEIARARAECAARRAKVTIESKE